MEWDSKMKKLIIFSFMLAMPHGGFCDQIAVGVGNPKPAISTQTVLTAGQYLESDRSVPLVSIPDEAVGVRVTIDVTDMTDPSNAIIVFCEYSENGGQSWIPLGTGIFHGGIPGPNAGIPPRVSNIEWSVPPGVGRLVRGSFLIRGPRVQISSNLEAF